MGILADVLVVINVFFLPASSIWIYYKRNNVKLEISFKLFLQYTKFVVYNVLLTKIEVFLVNKLLKLNRDIICIDSVYYTILASIAALILPSFLELLLKSYRRISVKINKFFNGKIYWIIVCLITASILVLTIVPYYGNLTEHRLSIEVLAGGNENRHGDSIRIEKIIVDGRSMKPESVLTEGNWVVDEGGLFTWRTFDCPANMERVAYGTVRASHKIEISFQADIYKSTAIVTLDGESQIVDCFFDSTTQNHYKSVDIYIKGYERFNLVLFLRNFIGGILIILLVSKAVFWGHGLIEQSKLVSLAEKIGDNINKKRSRYNRTKNRLALHSLEAVDKSNICHIKKYFVIPAMSIVLLVHSYITFSDRKLISNVEETMVEITPAFFYVRLGFLLIMSGLFLMLVFSKQLKIKNEDRMYYWLSIGLVLCSLCIRYPIRTWQVEPYWESYSNLLWQTYERGASGSILLDDSGYWTLLPRLIAIIALFVFENVQNAALISQLLLVALFVFINSKIVKKEFSDYLCTEIRFVIALLLGTAPFIAHSELLTLHNIGYYAVALMLLCCISAFDRVSWPIVFLDSVIAFLGCCSKLQGVVILPILLVILFVFWKRLCAKEKVFYGFCIIGCLMMIAYVLADMAETVGIGEIETDVTILFGASLKHIIQTFLFLIVPYRDSGYWGGCIINGIVVAALLMCLYLCIRKFERKSIICISLLAYMAGCTLLMALSWRLQFNGIGDFFRATSIYSDRNNFLLVFSVLLFVLVFFSGNFISFVNKGTLLSFCLLLLLMRFSFTPVGLGAYVNVNEQANWCDYSICLANDTYGMPGLNNGWFVLKNTKAYAYTNIEPNKMDGHFFSGVSKHIQLGVDPVNTLSLGDILSVVSVYAEKTYLLPEEEHIVLELRGSDGSILQQVEAIGDRDRYAIGFILEEPLDGVAGISFVNKDTGADYFVDPNIYVVVEAPNRGMSADAGWGINSLEE